MPKPTPDPWADFRNFLWMIWQHLNLPDPTDVQYDIAVYLQNGPRRSVIEAFRGVGKSWITAALVCWLLLRDPQTRIMVVSASKERADSFSIFVKRLIAEVPALQHLQARRDQRNSNISFEVGPARPDQSPSVKSVGITGQLTGSRANVIIADDIEVPNNSATQAQRDKIAELVKEFDAVLKPGGRIIYLGTPQLEQSLYNQLPDRGYEVRVWPALVPTDKQLESYGSTIAPYVIDKIARGAVQGTTMDPKRFSDEDLRERAVSYGRAGFSLQFMLDTRLSDADRYPLKVSDLIVMDVGREMAPSKLEWAAGSDQRIEDLPNVAMRGDRFHRPMWKSDTFAPFTGSVLFIDPAGRGRDETAYAVVKFLHGYLFLTAAGGFTDGYADDTLKGLAEIAKAQAVNVVLAEANFGDGMFTKILQPVMLAAHKCRIEEVKSSGQKERRIIDTLEPVMAQHRLIVDPSVIRKDYDSVSRYPIDKQHHYRLVHQLTRITKDRGALVQDDRLDALAGAVAYWTEQMARDAGKAHESHLEELRRRELNKFMESFGRGSQGLTFVSC